MREVVFRDTAEWLEARRKSVGSSDAPVILGVSAWSSPFALWCEKTGRVDHDPGTLRMRVGKAMEPLIHELVEEAGHRLEDPGDFAIAYPDDDDSRSATVDRYRIDEAGSRVAPFEFKHVGTLGDDWTEEEPSAYALVQLHHQLAITGHDHGYIGAMVGLGQRSLIYGPIPRHEGLVETILEAEEAFWQAVQSDTPPSPDGSEHTKRALAALYPADTGETIELEAEEWLGLAAQFEVAKARHKEARLVAEALEEEARAFENALRERMATATKAVIPGTTYAWTLKTTNRRGYTVEPTSYRVLRRTKP